MGSTRRTGPAAIWTTPAPGGFGCSISARSAVGVSMSWTEQLSGGARRWNWTRTISACATTWTSSSDARRRFAPKDDAFQGRLCGIGRPGKLKLAIDRVLRIELPRLLLRFRACVSVVSRIPRIMAQFCYRELLELLPSERGYVAGAVIGPERKMTDRRPDDEPVGRGCRHDGQRSG